MPIGGILSTGDESSLIALEIARRFLVRRCESGAATKKSRIEAIADV
jgi:hypothetical protein